MHAKFALGNPGLHHVPALKKFGKLTQPEDRMKETFEGLPELWCRVCFHVQGKGLRQGPLDFRLYLVWSSTACLHEIASFQTHLCNWVRSSGCTVFDGLLIQRTTVLVELALTLNVVVYPSWV